MKQAVYFWQNVKMAGRNFLPVLLGLVLLTTAVAANTTLPTKKARGESSSVLPTTLVPSASFKRMWIDYDVTQGGVKGMRIHTHFEVYNMKGIEGYLALYFQYRDGTSLKDNNNEFDSSEGTVAAYEAITPAYNPTTVYEDLDIFMPYSELDLEDGDYKLKIRANVIYKQGGSISLLTNYDFVYNQGDTKSNSTPSAEFDKVWVDYGVMQSGQRGMLVHVKFTVVDMKGVNGRLAVFFQKEDGDTLITSNRLYRSTDAKRVGELVVYYDIAPGYPRTVYEDATVFLPYSQLNLVLPRGNHSLRMDIDVVYKNGDLLQHMAMEDFWFDRK
ncbi:MAG: hypothetical protein WA584_06470 [Pyrinomonadaceae bacterium]